MADERDGYALLVSVSTREEAGVVVAALRAGGTRPFWATSTMPTR